MPLQAFQILLDFAQPGGRLCFHKASRDPFN
jgi:hypothetical protein